MVSKHEQFSTDTFSRNRTVVSLVTDCVLNWVSTLLGSLKERPEMPAESSTIHSTEAGSPGTTEPGGAAGILGLSKAPAGWSEVPPLTCILGGPASTTGGISPPVQLLVQVFGVGSWGGSTTPPPAPI